MECILLFIVGNFGSEVCVPCFGMQRGRVFVNPGGRLDIHPLSCEDPFRGNCINIPKQTGSMHVRSGLEYKRNPADHSRPSFSICGPRRARLQEGRRRNFMQSFLFSLRGSLCAISLKYLPWALLTARIQVKIACQHERLDNCGIV